MKLKGYLFLVIFCLSSLFVSGQTNSPVLFTVAGEPVTVKEFKYIYEKNNSGEGNLYSEKLVRDYLNLYTNFKLKVKAAKDAGLDTTSKFVKEYNNYRAQLAQPYLTDRQVTKRLMDEAYERLKYELRASHILLTVAPDASPKDTLAAYNKAMEVRERLLKGEDFTKVAKETSKDPSVVNNSGDLGYFTAFQMIYPFENGAYALKNNGDISMPIRTRFGYHIIKLTDRRPYRGEIQVRHILINSNDKQSETEQRIAKNKIDSLYSMLQKGADFKELAKKYSDHTVSKESGGEVPKFNSFATYPEEFKDAAFSLKKDGDFSKPFKTMFGWHIVQRIEQKGLPSEKEMEENLKQRIARDSRSEMTREAAIERFKKEDNYKEKIKNVQRFSCNLDSNLLQGKWKLKDNAKQMDKWIMKIGNETYTNKDLATYISNYQVPGRFTDVGYALKQYFKEFTNVKVLDYEDKNLENKHEEFRNIANEYKEGILLFEVTDKMVWSKAMQDSAGLQSFYEKNKDKYRWNERAEAQVLDVKDSKMAKEIIKELKAGHKTESITTALNKKDPLSVNIKEGVFEKKENKFVDMAEWKPGVYDLGMIDGRYYIVKINSIKKPDFKQLTEIRGLVISDYQDQLEKDWLNTLHQKYEVKINEDELKKIIK